METETAAKSVTDYYYDDVVIGATHRSPARLVTQENINTFADVAGDHHPIHSDEEYCRRTEFGRPISHGLYNLALLEGLTQPLGLYDHSICSLGWNDIRFLHPLFPGDRVYAVQEFTDKRRSRKPRLGVVTERLELRNQDDVPVISGEHVSMFELRDPEHAED